MAILNGIIKKMTGSAGQQRQRMKWVNKRLSESLKSIVSEK